MALIQLFVSAVATSTVVAVYECDPVEHSATPGDAAAGCEHALDDRFKTAEYAYQYHAEGLTMSPYAEVFAAPPLSKSEAKPVTREQAQTHLAEVLRIEREKLAALGHTNLGPVN
jgi:hypothetical protein